MEEIGYDDYFFGQGICLIEWADLIEEILPEKLIKVTIEKDLEKGFDYRRITVIGGEQLGGRNENFSFGQLRNCCICSSCGR